MLDPPLVPQPSPLQSEVADFPGNKPQDVDIKSQLEEIHLAIQQDMNNTKVMLAEMNAKQKQALQRQIETQMEYMLTQVQTSIGWRLKHHQTALLKEVQTLLTPITASITRMQEDVTRLQGEVLTSIKSVVEEITVNVLGMQHGSQTLSEQTDHTVYQEIPDTVTLPSRPRMESTARPLGSQVPLGTQRSTSLQLNRSRDSGKSPVKIQFPTYGKIEDPTDPLQYLERCEDYLALQTLTNTELMATLRNVLHGTARDWWDVARQEVHT